VCEIPRYPQKTTKISDGETVASAGYGSYVNQNLLLSFGVSYDNIHSKLFRPGIVWISQDGKRLFRRAHILLSIK
jgi:hypothetical protein